MTVTFSSRPEELRAADLSAVQSQLTLSQIMTPRASFISCVAEDSVHASFAGVPDVFDALPVIAGSDPGDKEAAVIGLVHRDRIPFRNRSATVRGVMDVSTLTSAHDVDRTLIAYMNGLNGEPLEFVVSGDEVVGLVTPYDLERLPVRTALFALIIDIEQAIGELVNLRLPDPTGWETLVERKLQGALRQGLKRAKENDNVGQAILSVDFNVKLELLQHCFERTEFAWWDTAEKDEVRTLRNLVAHGAPLRDVGALPGQVRRLFRLRRLVLDQLSSAPCVRKTG